VDQSTADGGEGGRRHQVVVIGSGFGGLFTTQSLKGADVQVTLIAKTTHHLFQPLLYQVATGILSEGEIAPSTREILRRQANAQVLLGEVTDIDLDSRTVTSTGSWTKPGSRPTTRSSWQRGPASPILATTSLPVLRRG
jgi:NADH:ubiquinone reductase (H+-translocating)